MMTVPSPTLYALTKDVVDARPWVPLAGCAGVANKVVYLEGGVTVGLLRFAPGASEVSHLHEHGEHHVWVIEGAVVVDDTTLLAGSYLHVPGHLVHTVSDVGQGSLLFYLFEKSG